MMNSPPPSPNSPVLRALEHERARRVARNRLARYQPYPKQCAFHTAGAVHRERLLRAGNQLGKTTAGAAETAIHLTGRYPAWWQGRRFERPVIGWALSVTGEMTRDNAQRMLVGRAGALGTGMLPADAILSVRNARGVADLVDTVRVRHVSGGESQLAFKFYEKGRERLQGETLDFVWFDEEPPPEIYTEGLSRTNATGGLVWITFTPLLGMSEVVRRFLIEPHADRHDTNMTIADATHIAEPERARIVASYATHERAARVDGTPALGSGRVFALADEAVSIAPFELPHWFALLGGLDFGWEHPTAAVRLAWDRDADVIYVTHAYRQAHATPVLHAAALRPWGDLAWAWPHDGLQHSKDSGVQLAEQYRAQGLRLLSEHAQFADGSCGVEAGLIAMLDRLQTGRLKVFAHLAPWFEEFRLYHRKDGLVVKEADDLLCATRYALMMLRHAREPSSRAMVHARGAETTFDVFAR
jgi:phage terminase large subunit-like protein